MLDTAKRSSLSELRREGARRRAEADPDPEATRRRIHKERFLRRWTDKEGAWNLQARGTPEDGSRFNTALDPILNAIFHTARREGRREPHEAYAFDALIEMAGRLFVSPDAGPAGNGHGSATSHTPADSNGAAPRPAPTPSGDPAPPSGNGQSPAAGGGQPSLEGLFVPPADDDPDAKPHSRPVNPTHLALLRVDLDALVRGHTDTDEVCEVAGGGPVSVTAARELLGESILKLVITRGTDVANITNLGRGPNAAQKVALLWSSPECTVLGCTRQYRQGIQHDHRTPSTQVRETALGNTDRLCDHHHDLKTRLGWALVAGTGKRPMVPPHDPRHPDNQPDTSSERSPPPSRR